MVSDSGAISLLRPWKVSRTMPSTNDRIISIAHCSLPGTPAVARRDTRMNSQKNTSTASSMKKMLSMLISQN